MNNHEQESNQISNFTVDSQNLPVTFIETMEVTKGVACDVYMFDDDTTKDLGIIKIKPGSKTPLQKVLKGDRTIEGFISGKGKLNIIKADGRREFHNVDKTLGEFSVAVEIGELMQWEANQDSDLVAYEICFPPYENGRFENLNSTS